MPDNSTITEVLRARQLVMRREMDRRGIAMKGVSYDSGIPYSTLLSYFPGDRNAVPAIMPVSAQYQLCDAIPDDVLSLLLPDCRLIVRVCEGVDHDKVAELMHDYLQEKEKAHHTDSPEGREISQCEDNVLRLKLTRVKAA